MDYNLIDKTINQNQRILSFIYKYKIYKLIHSTSSKPELQMLVSIPILVAIIIAVLAVLLILEP
jgi:hypothetical protein